MLMFVSTRLQTHGMATAEVLFPPVMFIHPSRLCHDDVCDHRLDRYTVSEMVCMLCGVQQPVAGRCRHWTVTKAALHSLTLCSHLSKSMQGKSGPYAWSLYAVFCWHSVQHGRGVRHSGIVEELARSEAPLAACWCWLHAAQPLSCSLVQSPPSSRLVDFILPFSRPVPPVFSQVRVPTAPPSWPPTTATSATYGTMSQGGPSTTARSATCAGGARAWVWTSSTACSAMPA
jgi:hypothetical protein